MWRCRSCKLPYPYSYQTLCDFVPLCTHISTHQVNSPLTALGLITALVDVAYISRLLLRAFTSQNDSSYLALLERYSTLRRTDYIKNVQKFLLEGKLRMHSTGRKVVAERENFFYMLIKNPGFGMFVASTMVNSVPDELDAGFFELFFFFTNIFFRG